MNESTFDCLYLISFSLVGITACLWFMRLSRWLLVVVAGLTAVLCSTGVTWFAYFSPEGYVDPLKDSGGLQILAAGLTLRALGWLAVLGGLIATFHRALHKQRSAFQMRFLADSAEERQVQDWEAQHECRKGAQKASGFSANAAQAGKLRKNDAM